MGTSEENRLKHNLWSYLPALLFTVGLGIYYAFFSLKPFEDFDPQYIQYFNAVHFLETGQLGEHYNPGIPIGLFLAFVQYVFFLVSGEPNMHAYLMEHSEVILNTSNFILLLASVLTVWFANWRCTQHLNRNTVWMVLSPLLITYTLFPSVAVSSPQPFMVIFGLLFVIHFYIESTQIRPFGWAILAVSSKFTMLPFVSLSYLANGRKRDIVKLGVILVGLALIVFLFIDNSKATLNFLMRAPGGGEYGYDQDMQHETVWKGAAFLFKRNPVFYTVWLVLTALFITSWKRLSTANRRQLALLLLADVILYVLVIRHRPSSYYMVPVILWMIPKLYILRIEVMQFLTRFKKPLFGLGVVGIILLGRMAFNRIGVVEQQRSTIDPALLERYNAQAPDQPIMDGMPSVQFALWFGEQSILNNLNEGGK